MSVVEEEVVNLLKNKFFVVGLDNQLCKWNSSKFIEVYHLLLSVLNSSYDQQCDNEENSLKHISRCVRLLGLGHLIAKPRSLVDFRKAPRIITALEDKITARYGNGTAQRIRSVIKALEKKKSHKVKSCKQVKLKDLEHQENEEPSTTLSKPTIAKPSGAGTILTGRQLPRTPMRVLNACNVNNSNSRQSLTLSPMKNTGQQGTVTKKLSQNLKSCSSVECEDIFEKVTDVKEGNEQISAVPTGSSNSGKIPLCRQLNRTPDLHTSNSVLHDEHKFTLTETTQKTELQTPTSLGRQLSHTQGHTSKNALSHEHKFTSTETTQKTELETPAPLCKQLSCTPDLNTTKTVLPNQHEVTSTEATLKTEIDQTSAPYTSSCSSRVDTSNCNNISNVVICDQSSINEKYQGPSPSIISPPEEFRNDLLPQCTLNSKNERNSKSKFSALQSSPSDGVPQNMGTCDLSVIENLPAVYDDCKSSEVTSQNEETISQSEDKFVQDVRTGNISVPQDVIALHEDATVPYLNSSVQNMYESYTLPQALSSSLGNKIPLGRQLSRTPPFIVLEQKSDTKASDGNVSTKTKSCNTSDITSVSSDISCDATSKAGLGKTFIVSSEKEECISSGDLHGDSSVTEGSLAVQKAANEDDLKGQDEGGTDNILQELLEATKNLYDDDNSLQIFSRRKQRKQVKPEEFSRWLESSLTVKKELIDENNVEHIFEVNTSRRSSIFPDESRLSILEEQPVLSASYSFHCGRESSQSPKRLSILENSIPTGKQLCRTPPLHLVGRDSGTLCNSTSKGNSTLSSGLSEKVVGLETGVEHERKPTSLGDSENIVESPNITKESCNNLTSVVSGKAVKLQTSVELETKSDILTDSENIAEPPNVTENYNSLSSIVSEKSNELETGTDVLETDGSHIKLGLPVTFNQEDIHQIMLEIDEDESFEIFPKEKKTREIKEKTDNVTCTAAGVVLKDTGDVSKENFRNVVTKAETCSGENLEHVGHVLKTVVPEKHRDESYEIPPEKKTTKVENRNTLRKIAVKNMAYNKRKGNRGKDCMEDDVITDCKSLQPSGKASRQNAKNLEKSCVFIEGVHKDKQVSDMDDSLAQISSETVKKSEPGRKTRKQNIKIEEEELHHILSKDLEVVHKDKQVSDMDDSFAQISTETVKKSEPGRKTRKQNIKIKEEELHHILSKDLEVVHKDKQVSDMDDSLAQISSETVKKSEPGRKTRKQNIKIEEEELHHILSKDLEVVHKDKQVSDMDDLLAQISTETVKKSEPGRKTRKQNIKIKEEELHHILSKDLEVADESLQFFSERIPTQSAIRNSNKDNKKTMSVESNPEEDEKPNPQKKGTSRQKTGLQEKNLDNMSTKDVQVYSDTDVRKSEQARTLRKSARCQKKKFHHMLLKDVNDKHEQVYRPEDELTENFLDRDVYPGNGSSSREAVEKTAVCNEGLVNQGYVADGLVTDKQPRNKQIRTLRQATKIHEEKSYFTKGVQEDIQDSMSNDSFMKVLSETTTGKMRRQTKKTGQHDDKVKGKESHHMLTTNIQEGHDDYSTSLIGLKHHDENILDEGILHTLNTLKKQRGRRRKIKKDAAIDPTGDTVSSEDQTPNKVQKITCRRTRNKVTGSVAPAVSEKCQKFDSGRNVDENSGVARGKYCKDKECDIVSAGSSEGDTGDVLFGKKENQYSETMATKDKTPEASKVGICRQIRKRQAKYDTAQPEIITKTRGAKKRFMEKTDSNAKEGEGEYTHSQEDFQSSTTDGKRRGRNAKKGKDMAFNSPPSKTVNSSTDRINPSENEAGKETSCDRARVTRKGKTGCKRTAEMKLTVSYRESPVKVAEPVGISERKARRTTNLSKLKDVVETRESKRPSNGKGVEPLERKTRRTINDYRFKDAVETSETKKASNVKETKAKKNRKKS
ncbi:uncharacterized protein LOC143028553 [Oratosquilla oratoria]|uniref:uncharacterized protein LOC143028553 n=1 Tax=Oratosquilla oratoria TaxID=337810 RepID=UPI003F775AAE